jgi:hypothetical protein
MTLQASVLARNAMLDAFETYGSTAPVLKIKSGSPPATPETADSGTVLATLTLDSDWMNAAADAAKTMKGTWADSLADADGTAGHFRLYKSDGTTCILQGTVTATGDGGDMTVQNTSFAENQPFSVTTFTLSLA